MSSSSAPRAWPPPASYSKTPPPPSKGIFFGNTSTLGLMVKNVNLDDVGSYAADAFELPPVSFRPIRPPCFVCDPKLWSVSRREGTSRRRAPYTVKARPALESGSRQPLSTSSASDNGAERTVTDSDAGGVKKFYRIEITRP